MRDFVPFVQFKNVKNTHEGKTRVFFTFLKLYKWYQIAQRITIVTLSLSLQVVPRNLIFAHGAKIIDIACALDASFNRPNIVSLAENG